MKALIYRDRRGEWRWRLTARNGRVIADGGEGYARKGNALRAWARFAELASLMRLTPEVRE